MTLPWPALAQGQGGQQPLRYDVVAVVLSDAGLPRGSITICYPGAVSVLQASEDLRAMQAASDWQFGQPVMTPLPDATQAVASMQPAARVAEPYGEAFWPVVWALRRFNRVTIVVLGDGYQGTPGTITNRHVRVVSSGGGAVWTYDVSVLDRNCSSLAQMMADAEVQGVQEHKQDRRWRWLLVIALALGLAVAVYALTARLARCSSAAGLDRSQRRLHATRARDAWR